MILLAGLFLATLTPCPLPDRWGVYSGTKERPNLIGIDETKQISWNAVPVTDDELLNWVARSQAFSGGQLIVRMRKDDCETLKRIADLVADEGNCDPEKCVVDFDWRDRARAMSPLPPPAPPPPPGR